MNYDLCKNNLRVTALKFSIFKNYSPKYQNLRVQAKTHDHFGGLNFGLSGRSYVFLAM